MNLLDNLMRDLQTVRRHYPACARCKARFQPGELIRLTLGPGGVVGYCEKCHRPPKTDTQHPRQQQGERGQ